MLIFETMPMEGKLVLIGFICLLWSILDKILNPKKDKPVSKIKFVLLHTFLGWIAGIIIGLILSTFTERIDIQTKYSLVCGIICAIVLFIYAMLIKDQQKITKIFNSDREWAETGWVSLFAAAVIMYCFIQAFKIPTGSMRKTLIEGDHLFVNKFIYGIKIPFTQKKIFKIKKVNRQDIIIFSCPPKALSTEEQEKKIQKDFIKRCIGLPGDKIEIKNKVVYVNDTPLQEPYLNFEDETIYQTQKIYNTSEEYQRAWEQGRFTELPAIFIRDNFGPVVVPPGTYFVLGDNRDRSFDSRFWGPLEEKYIKGAPLIVYWPPKRIRIPH